MGNCIVRNIGMYESQGEEEKGFQTNSIRSPAQDGCREELRRLNYLQYDAPIYSLLAGSSGASSHLHQPRAWVVACVIDNFAESHP